MTDRNSIHRPVCNPADVVAVLLVTAAAHHTVTSALNGIVSRRQIPARPGQPATFKIEKLSPRRRKAAFPGTDLSQRQREVLVHLSIGKTNAEIGQALHLSVETVRTHVKSILNRLGARNRAHAVQLAQAKGLFGDNPGA